MGPGAPEDAPVGRSRATERSEGVRAPRSASDEWVRTGDRGEAQRIRDPVRRAVGCADHLVSERSGEAERSEDPKEQGASPSYALFLLPSRSEL